MKQHFCPSEQSIITYQVQCNWCGEKEWVGLTNEEQQELYDQWQGDGWGSFYQAIEAKLKDKNT